jgi:hypothetical protein
MPIEIRALSALTRRRSMMTGKIHMMAALSAVVHLGVRQLLARSGHG